MTTPRKEGTMSQSKERVLKVYPQALWHQPMDANAGAIFRHGDEKYGDTHLSAWLPTENEAWDDGDDGMDGYVTEERCEESFVAGLQAMREMLARFVEQGGDATTAMSIRANWNPKWGTDPGRPEEVADDCWS